MGLDDQINIPANDKNQWKWRMCMPMEVLLTDSRDR